MGRFPDEPGDLFAGPHSLRYPSERRAFWLTLAFAPLTAGIVATVLHSPFTVSEVGVLLVVAMVYVTVARGRLLGTSLRVTERQFPDVLRVVRRCCTLLGVPEPVVFVREDLFTPVTSFGLSEPYAILISSEWLGHLDEDELAFAVGCELAHIHAGHTRISSLFSASGHENPFVALVFGAWLRRTEYTADRVGLLCCGSVEAAARALCALSFRHLKAHVDMEAFLEQRRAIETDASLAMGEWLGETPYGVNRLVALRTFAQTPLYGVWQRRLALGPLPAPQATRVRDDGPVPASFLLRSLACLVDLVIVGAIAFSGGIIVNQGGPQDLPPGAAYHGVVVGPEDVRGLRQVAASGNAGPAIFARWLLAHHALTGLALTIASCGLIFFWMLYSALMVGILGRTCGMLVFDLRVARGNDVTRPPGFVRSLWRYLLGGITCLTVVPWLLGALTGWWPHEHLSGTRLWRTLRLSA
jgi:Zn-dependent protease with chaperone function